MSLINQMLQDLDARRAAHGVDTNLPNDVRPLPKPQASRFPLVLAGVLLTVLAGGFAAYHWEIQRQTVSVPLAIEKAADTPAPQSTTAPPTAEPEHSAQPDLPRAAQEAPAVLSLDKIDGSLRMADFIKPPAAEKDDTKSAGSALPPAVASRATAVSSQRPVLAETKSADQRSKKEAAERQSTPPGAMAQETAGRSTKTPMIERTDSVGTPRDRAESEYRKAIAAVNLGRVAEAMEGLRNALRQDDMHVAARQLLVKLLLEAKQPDEAVQVLHDGLQGQPMQIGWAMSLARLQLDRGDIAAAWQTLDASLPAAGRNADYQGFAAHVLQRLGRNHESAEYYLAATRLSPGEGRWWLGLGLAREAEGRPAEAREALLRAKASGTLAAELASLVDQKLGKLTN